MIAAFTDQNFENEVLNFKGVVLAVFGAEYCPGCLTIASIIEELENEYQGIIKIGKIDILYNPKTPEKYGVMSLPVLIIFKNGNIKEEIIGVRPKLEIKEKLDKVLKSE